MTKREITPEQLRVGDKVTMVTSRVETREGVVTEVDVRGGTFRLREEGQLDGLRFHLGPPVANNKTISTRTFFIEEPEWQEGDVACNPLTGQTLFLERDSWVDCQGEWQANRGAKSTLSYFAIVRGGEPVRR